MCPYRERRARSISNTCRSQSRRGCAGVQARGYFRCIRLSFLRSLFRAAIAFLLRFTLGFSYARRFLVSVSTPDFCTCFLKRRNAFSNGSSSLTYTPGIQILSFLRTCWWCTRHPNACSGMDLSRYGPCRGFPACHKLWTCWYVGPKAWDTSTLWRRVSALAMPDLLVLAGVSNPFYYATD